MSQKGADFIWQTATNPQESATFSTFILGLASTILIHLGEGENPETIQLPLARQCLDFLGILHDKTQGNLTTEESRLLCQILTDLRLLFVHVQQKQKPQSPIPPL
ncbi:MAG: DUF1844 domain-containing protein [Proteobacteria bacterium]|nr:DUF1844 domain-containing protein [Cystobacterineae bacterium]MCL2314322.1 DUF1844 domain-containing protein [Pseudomonadota bacterium]